MSRPECPDGITRRGAVGTLAAAAATFPAAIAAPTVAKPSNLPLKIFSIVARKPALSPDSFRQHWLGIHGPMARTVPGIGRFILSEAVQESAAPAPDAHYRDRFDGVAHIWYPGQDALRAGMATAQARAWLADGDLFIDRAASRNFFVSEQIVVPPPRLAGGIKRTALIVRKPGMSHAAFMDHWTTIHARLAQGVPGLLGCVFNRIDSALGVKGDPWAEIDGMAEIWWDGGALNLGGRVVSPQSTAWAADGDNFIDRAKTRTIVSIEHVMIPQPGGVA